LSNNASFIGTYWIWGASFLSRQFNLLQVVVQAFYYEQEIYHIIYALRFGMGLHQFHFLNSPLIKIDMLRYVKQCQVMNGIALTSIHNPHTLL
jgi:hypothetical protein